MAERRTRPHVDDRRLISERTAKTLRMQASALHIYRGRTHHRFINPRYTADFLLEHEDDRSEEEAEEAELLDAGISSGGGAALYDAYLPFRPPPTRSYLADAVPFTRQTVTSPRPVSPPPPILPRDSIFTSLPSLLGPSTSTSLSRQRAARRPLRSRTTDFTDFATRRRSIVRANAELSDTVRAEDSADGTWRFASQDRVGSTDPAPSSSTNRFGRRFSPLTAWSDPHLRINAGADTPWTLSPAPDDRVDSAEPSTSHQSSSQLWYSFTGRRSPSAGDRPTGAVPRLRRGGLHAPESMFSRYTSPATESTTPQPDVSSGISEEPSSSRLSTSSGPSGRIQNSEMDALDEASRQLLTPRSISPAVDVYHM
jgi:hypothetical protein